MVMAPFFIIVRFRSFDFDEGDTGKRRRGERMEIPLGSEEMEMVQGNALPSLTKWETDRGLMPLNLLATISK